MDLPLRRSPATTVNRPSWARRSSPSRAGVRADGYWTVMPRSSTDAMSAPPPARWPRPPAPQS
ncbi:hypothetical protein ACFFX0_23260 [Citricoccus parietis]|uniref:Uncharacterized protein n=1 Tax=Citricoccus parietis TaxID=592307 RepID=A0ABV5G4U1_9MICC